MVCGQWVDESVSEDGLHVTGTRMTRWPHDMGVPKERVRVVDASIQETLVEPKLCATVESVKKSKVNTTQFLP